MVDQENDKPNAIPPVTIRIIDIPGLLHRRFKTRCAENGTDMTKKVIELITKYVYG